MRFNLIVVYKDGMRFDHVYDENEIEGTILERIQNHIENNNVKYWKIIPLVDQVVE